MGRASMIMVMSYSTVLMMMGYNISKVSTQAYENYIGYYDRTNAHNIVASAANMAAYQLYDSAQWRAGFTDKPIFGGTATATITQQLNADSTLKLHIVASYKTYTDTVIVILRPSSFSKFSYYSNIEGNIWWTTGDTVWGPIHTQDYLGVANSPVFMGKATAKLGLEKYNKSATPQFLGGPFEGGVDIALPSNLNQLTAAAAAGGRFINRTDSAEVRITFNGDSAVVRYGPNPPDTTVYLPTWAPNGALVVRGGNLRVSGNVNQSLTLGAIRAPGQNEWNNTGKVRFDDNFTYTVDPVLYPDSNTTTIVGVVAQDSLVITDNSANDPDIKIHAALFSLEKGLGAEHYNNNNERGKIELLGGITQNKRAAVGTFSGGSITSGYSKRYRYDERLRSIKPPFFPSTGSYEVLSWYER
ncbi:MAG TPA: hypothetical protein VII11_04555 [Bacteroidota bacterium]